MKTALRPVGNVPPELPVGVYPALAFDLLQAMRHSSVNLGVFSREAGLPYDKVCRLWLFKLPALLALQVEAAANILLQVNAARWADTLSRPLLEERRSMRTSVIP